MDEVSEDGAPGLGALAAHALDREHTFWPSSRTPRTTSSEMEVALRSSRTRTTVPSRIRRTIGSSVSERVFQESQSLFTLRQVRLTVSLPTVPPNKAASARRTRRVLAGEKGARDQRVLHAKALNGNPYDGHTLGPVVADLEKLTGVAARRIHGDKGYRATTIPTGSRSGSAARFAASPKSSAVRSGVAPPSSL